jgi:hypothetical protein
MKKIALSFGVVLFLCANIFATEKEEKELLALRARIDELEKWCAPARGTSRDALEIFFGKGKPSFAGKIPPKNLSEDSPYRTYRLCKDGVLFVRYENNKVQFAHYIDPYSIKGSPLNIGQKKRPVAGRLIEARNRLSQMKVIFKEYLKKRDSIPFGLLGHPLGAYLTIEGVRFEGGKTGVKTLLVDKVNGKKLEKPITIWIKNVILPKGERCILNGYESGNMVGVPEKAIKIENMPQPQKRWSFFKYFIVTSSIQPENLLRQKTK